MHKCSGNSSPWRVLLLITTLCLTYFYLYRIVRGGFQSNVIYRVVEDDLQAVEKTKFGTMSLFLNFTDKDNAKITFEIAASNASIPKPQKVLTDENVPALDTEAMAMSKLKVVLKEKIIMKESYPLLTLFTSWTDNREKYLVHNLTLRNWLSLRPYVIPVIFTNEPEIADRCRIMGWEVLPVRVAAAGGIPVLKYMYQDVMGVFNTTFYAYSNGDILYTDSLIDTLLAVVNSHIDINAPVMLVGKRTNVDRVKKTESSTWENLKTLAKTRGKLFVGYAEDYFITTRVYPWKNIAEVVIGRVAYDNWLVWYAREQKQTVIDATKTLLAVHQTTAAGNSEGHRHENGKYNRNLLVKLYEGIKFFAGSVSCAEHYTQLDATGNIVFVRRTVPKNCRIP